MKSLIILIYYQAFLAQVRSFTDKGNTVECERINYGCDSCKINKNLETFCNTCKIGYQLINNSCEYDAKQCTHSQGQECKIPFCLKQSTDSLCQKCIIGFEEHYLSNISSECRFKCDMMDGNLTMGTLTVNYLEDSLACHTKCFDQNENCEKCSYRAQASCSKCSVGFFLYQKRCVSQCPESTYVNEQNSCIPCQNQCKKCSQPTSCLSCNEELKFSPLFCKYPSISSDYQQKCSDISLFNTHKISGKCVRKCQDNQYPFYVDDTEYSCHTVKDWNNDYCYNMISQLPTLITIWNERYNLEQLHLLVEIKEIPVECISLIIYGDHQVLVYPSSYSQDNGVQYDFFILNSDIQNPDYVTCSTESCLLQLHIYWGGQIQYIYSLQVSIDLKSIISSELASKGNAKIGKIACPECVIPQEEIIVPTLIINCRNDQICTDDFQP